MLLRYALTSGLASLLHELFDNKISVPLITHLDAKNTYRSSVYVDRKK